MTNTNRSRHDNWHTPCMGSTAIIVLICLSSVLLLLIASVLGFIPSHDDPDHQSARERREQQQTADESRRSMHVKRSAPE